MIEIKICLTESDKAIKADETGLAVELVTDSENPTELEKEHARSLCELIRVYMNWTAENQCVRSAYIEGKASPKAFDEFINSMGVETIAQREAKKSG